MGFLASLRSWFFPPEKEEKEQGATIRFASPDDLPALLSIENASDQVDVWSAKDFGIALGDRKRFRVLILEYLGIPVGYVAVQRHGDSLIIWSIATKRGCLRKGVASNLMRAAIHMGGKWRRNKVVMSLRESALTAQQFLRSQGFVCTQIVYGGYEDPPEDGFYFEWMR